MLEKILEEVGCLKTEVGGLKDQIGTLVAEFVDVREYIKEDLVTGGEFNEKIDEVTTHIDGFINLHTTLDQELVALHHKYDRLEDRLVRVEKKLGIATV